jgi:hypothetical protein
MEKIYGNLRKPARAHRAHAIICIDFAAAKNTVLIVCVYTHSYGHAWLWTAVDLLNLVAVSNAFQPALTHVLYLWVF